MSRISIKFYDVCDSYYSGGEMEPGLFAFYCYGHTT